MSYLVRLAADMGRLTRQHIGSFCDLHTATPDALVTHLGEGVTVIRILGVRRTLSEVDVASAAEGLRLELSGLLERPGHAMQWWYASDPTLATEAVRQNQAVARATAAQLGMRLDGIFAERERRMPQLMRWEACYLILWTRLSALTREERKQADLERAAAAKGFPRIGDAQNPFLATEIVSAEHQAYVARVVAALRGQGVGYEIITPHQMLAAARESILPETTGSGWKARLPGDPFAMVREPMQSTEGTADHLLCPSLRDQIFTMETEEVSATVHRIGDHDWRYFDMTLGPEQARPFAELVQKVVPAHIPWRVSFLIEGGGHLLFAIKEMAASLIGFGPNRKVWQGIEAVNKLAANNKDIPVRVRISFATWASAGEGARLRRQAALLESRVQAWGNLQVGAVAGDPLAGVMSSALAMAPASTAPPAMAPLREALQMLPFGRPGSPWTSGPVLFRTPDGRMWPYDPAGSQRQRVVDLFSGPSRRGKSVLSNTFDLGLLLSTAAQGTYGARLPMIGKIEIGRSAEGLVILLREALPEGRKDEAIYVPFDLTPEYAVNPLDTQTGCREPLPLERAAQESLLMHIATPVGSPPPEGLGQLVSLTLAEAYRMFGTEGPNLRTKRYQPGLEPEVDDCLHARRLSLPDQAYWWEVVDALCTAREYRLADLAQRHAVPRLEDLITAARSPQIKQLFGRVVPHREETLGEMFERYLKAAIRRFETLNRPTEINFGPARVIVIDLDAVAPTGSPDADWQTGLMYMLARHMIGRNFFLRPQYADLVPDLVRDHHRRRFTEVYEAAKRLEFEEFHRTANQPAVRAQFERDGREGGKHGVQIAGVSQRMSDFGEYLLTQATGRFICGVGDTSEADDVVERLKLSPSTAQIVRHRLTGPSAEGAGAPFVAVVEANDAVWEQMLVNSLGPIELWALSTTPEDVALRSRLYDCLGFGEALKRLAVVFDKGTALPEIERRKKLRLAQGEDDDAAKAGVVQDLADELTNGTGLGIVLRPAA